MTPRRRFALALAICVSAGGMALIAGALTGRSAMTAGALPPGGVPEQALSELFASRFDDHAGRPQPFSQWKGKFLVVNFWAAWCAPCREEIPYFSRIHEKYAAKGVQFVGISTDSPEQVRAFARTHPTAYPLLVGGPDAIELSVLLGNSRKGLPYTIVLSKKGEPLLTRTGPLPELELENMLRGLN